MADGQQRGLQLSPQGEEPEGDLEAHQTDRHKGLSFDSGLDRRGKNRRGGHHGHRQGGGKGQLAVQQQPFTEVTRLEAVVDSPLAGHGTTKHALTEHQNQADDRKGKPPSWGGLGEAPLRQELIQGADPDHQQQGRGQVSRHRGGGQETGHGKGPQRPLNSHQSQGEGGRPGIPGGELSAPPHTQRQENKKGDPYKKSVETMEPFEKDPRIHLPTGQKNPITKWPIGTGKTRLHDPGRTTNDHQGHQGDHEMGGEPSDH